MHPSEGKVPCSREVQSCTKCLMSKLEKKGAGMNQLRILRKKDTDETILLLHVQISDHSIICARLLRCEPLTACGRKHEAYKNYTHN